MMTHLVHGAVINCIDGRVQEVVTDYLCKRWHVEYVDVITEAAPARVLAERTDGQVVSHLRSSVLGSLRQQASPRLALAAHSDCESDPVPEAVQREHLNAAVAWLTAEFRQAEVIGLWVDQAGHVCEQVPRSVHHRHTAKP